MTTATTPRRTSRKAVSAETTERSRIDRADATELIAAEDLHDHPANPSTRVSAEAIKELAQSIGVYGQREVVRVRPWDAIEREGRPRRGYEILSGHRRVAACRMLGLSVRCEIVDCDDVEALREVMLGNAERSDLNPIERAELMQTMIDSGIDRSEAGAMFGLTSESGVKNTLRLLALPESMRNLIIDGKLPVRVARAAVPFADAPELVDRWAEKLSKDEWELYDAVRDPENFFSLNLSGNPKLVNVDARPIDGITTYNCGWEYGHGLTRRFDLDSLPDAVRESLRIVELPHEGKRIPVALNVGLFDDLNQPFLKKRSSYGSSGKPKPPKLDPKAATPKQLAAEKRRKDKEAAEQLARSTQIFARRFKMQCLARQTQAGHAVILSSLPWLLDICDDRQLWIRAATSSMGCDVAKQYQFDILTPLIAVSDDANGFDDGPSIGMGYAIADRLWRLLLWPQRLRWPCGNTANELPECVTAEPPQKTAINTRTSMYDEQFKILLDYADVSIFGGWRDLVDDPADVSMLVEFLNLHTIDQLHTLVKDWQINSCSGVHAKKLTKKELVKRIAAAHTVDKPLPLPECLQDKPARKKRGRK